MNLVIPIELEDKRVVAYFFRMPQLQFYGAPTDPPCDGPTNS